MAKIYLFTTYEKKSAYAVEDFTAHEQFLKLRKDGYSHLSGMLLDCTSFLYDYAYSYLYICACGEPAISFTVTLAFSK